MFLKRRVFLALVLMLIGFGGFSFNGGRAYASAQKKITEKFNQEIKQTAKISQDKQAQVIELYFASGCRYCEEEQKYLDKLQRERQDIVVRRHEISASVKESKKLNNLLKKKGISSAKVPITIIGEQIIIGFDKDKTPKTIKAALQNPDQSNLTYGSTCDTGKDAQCKVENETIKVPFFGKIDPRTVSLPFLTVALGLADGFNPCAMWALIALLGILIGLKSRKKLIIIGGAFLIFSYLIYVVFMAAWLNVFLFIGYLRWVQITVGVIAIAMGISYFNNFLRTDPATCKVAPSRQKNALLARIKKIAASDWLPLALLGVALLAIAVNTIEALCSVGIPAVYTKTLADAGLNKIQYAGYIGAYNVFYMLDDIIIFAIAVFSKDLVNLSPRYRYLGMLLGAVVLLTLGLIFILDPSILSL